MIGTVDRVRRKCWDSNFNWRVGTLHHYLHTMNLDKAFVLLFASLGAVAGFTPASLTFSKRVASYVPKQVAPIFSEVEEATEAPAAVEEPVATVEEPAAAEAPFDTSIYVGNISFGEYTYYVLMESCVLLLFAIQTRESSA